MEPLVADDGSCNPFKPAHDVAPVLCHERATELLSFIKSETSGGLAAGVVGFMADKAIMAVSWGPILGAKKA